MSAVVAPPIYGLLLSGGASRRMQRDKAQLAYAGQPQLMRAWHLLEAVTERAFVSVRAEQRDDPLRAGLPTDRRWL
jgi:Molybdopterin-guanine dinucleotide biosynthesis protein A